MSGVDKNNTAVTWLGLNFGEQSSRDKRAFSCPDPIAMAPYTFKMNLPVEFFGYDLCRCSEGYVGVPPHGCKPCPPHMECRSTSGKGVAWARGFYPVFSRGKWVAALPCPDYGLGSGSACNPSGQCSAMWNDRRLSSGCQLCSPHSDGRLCSRCQCPAPEGADHSCYFASHRMCVPCNEDVVAGVTAALAVVCLVVIALAVGSCVRHCRHWRFFRALRRAASEVGESGAIKVALIFAQTTATINSGWPEWVQAGGMRLLGVTNADVTGTGIECLLHWMSNPVANLGVSLGIVPVATVVLCVVVAVRTVYACIARRSSSSAHSRSGTSVEHQASMQVIVPPPSLPPDEARLVVDLRGDSRWNADHPDGSRPWESGIRTWLWLAYWLVFEIAVRSFDVFNCTEQLRTDTRWMSTVPWLRCSDTTEWDTMSKMGFTSLGILVFGIPVAFAALLFAFRHRRSSSAPRLHATADADADDIDKRQRAMAVVAPLVACYRPSMHWFELVVTLRRIVLAFAFAYVPESNLARSGLIELVLLGSLAVQHWLVPYRRAVDNRLEELALGTAATTFAVQSVWRGMNQLETATLQEVSVAGSDFADILVTLDWYAPALMGLLVGLNVAVLVVLAAFVVWPFVAQLWRWLVVGRRRPTVSTSSH